MPDVLASSDELEWGFINSVKILSFHVCANSVSCQMSPSLPHHSKTAHAGLSPSDKVTAKFISGWRIHCGVEVTELVPINNTLTEAKCLHFGGGLILGVLDALLRCASCSSTRSYSLGFLAYAEPFRVNQPSCPLVMVKLGPRSEQDPESCRHDIVFGYLRM